MSNLNREDFKELVYIIMIVLIFAYFFLVTFIELKESSQRFADIILGALIGLILKLTSDYFGNNGGVVLRKDEDEEYSDNS